MVKDILSETTFGDGGDTVIIPENPGAGVERGWQCGYCPELRERVTRIEQATSDLKGDTHEIKLDLRRLVVALQKQEADMRGVTHDVRWLVIGVSTLVSTLVAFLVTWLRAIWTQ